MASASQFPEPRADRAIHPIKLRPANSIAPASCQYDHRHAAGPSKEPAVTRASRAAFPGMGQRGQPGCRGRYRELREVPATDQAIRAGRPGA